PVPVAYLTMERSSQAGLKVRASNMDGSTLDTYVGCTKSGSCKSPAVWAGGESCISVTGLGIGSLEPDDSTRREENSGGDSSTTEMLLDRNSSVGTDEDPH